MAADDRPAKTWFIRTAIISILPSPIYLMISDTDLDGPATFSFIILLINSLTIFLF